MSRRKGSYIGYYSEIYKANKWAKSFVGATKIKVNDRINQMMESLGRQAFGLEQSEKPKDTEWDKLTNKEKLGYYNRHK